MPTRLRAYTGDGDFERIRRFLSDTYALYQRPFNWLIDHWNFCRYHVVTLHTYYSRRHFGVPVDAGGASRDELQAWERAIGIWEDERGEIVGVVHTENEEPGEAWFEIHPDHAYLYAEMVEFAEARLACWTGGLGYVKLYVNTGTELEELVRKRGYRPVGATHTWLERRINALPEPRLPPDFVIRSVADEDDVERRRAAKALAFGGHYCPLDWPPAAAFRELQRAPDYRAELDLFVVAPTGDYVSFCTGWVDERNHYADFEPVGTHVEYRRLGLARAVMAEGLRRMAARGAERSYMEANPHFYSRVGFEPTPYGYREWVRYLS